MTGPIDPRGQNSVDEEGVRPMAAPASWDEYERYRAWLRDQEQAGLDRLTRMPERLSVTDAASFLRVPLRDIMQAIRAGDVAVVMAGNEPYVATATLFDDLGIRRPRGAQDEGSGGTAS